MNKQILIGIIGAVVALVIILLVRKYYIKKYTMELMQCLMNDDIQPFLNKLDSFGVKTLFPPFNREYMRLNYYMAHGMDKKVKEQISMMDKMKADRKQRFASYQSAFQYFVSVNSESNAKNMQRKMNAFIEENNLDPELKKKTEMEMRIYFDKDIKTIPYIDEQLQNCSEAETAVWNFKKAFIYKANHKLDEAMKCMQIVVDTTTDPTQKKVMQELMDHNLKDL